MPRAWLSAPAVGIHWTPSYNGYWIASADGAVYAFGEGQPQGRAPDRRPGASIVSIVF